MLTRNTFVIVFQVKRKIKDSPNGFDGVNETVKKRLAEWLKTQFHDMVDN